MYKTEAGAVVKTHAYNLFPKTRFTPGKITVDKKELEARLTCKDHAKFPCYTYFQIDGKTYYAKGDFLGATLVTAEEPKEEPKKEEPAPAKKK